MGENTHQLVHGLVLWAASQSYGNPGTGSRLVHGDGVGGLRGRDNSLGGRRGGELGGGEERRVAAALSALGSVQLLRVQGCQVVVRLVVVVLVVVVVVLVAIEVVVLWVVLGELTAGEEAAEGLPELVRHGVVQDRVDSAGKRTERENMLGGMHR